MGILVLPNEVGPPPEEVPTPAFVVRPNFRPLAQSCQTWLPRMSITGSTGAIFSASVLRRRRWFLPAVIITASIWGFRNT